MTAKEEKQNLRIELSGNKKSILLTALNEKRFTHYGFGTFLENIIPSEILITEEALEVLLRSPERSGLQGLELWPDNRLAWGTLTLKAEIPIEDINKMKGAERWLKQCPKE